MPAFHRASGTCAGVSPCRRFTVPAVRVPVFHHVGGTCASVSPYRQYACRCFSVLAFHHAGGTCAGVSLPFPAGTGWRTREEARFSVSSQPKLLSRMVPAAMKVPNPFRCPISRNSLALRLRFEAALPPGQACAAAAPPSSLQRSRQTGELP